MTNQVFIGRLGGYDLWYEKNPSLRGVNNDCLVLQSSNDWDAEYIRDIESVKCSDDRPWEEALELFRSMKLDPKDDPSVSPNAA